MAGAFRIAEGYVEVTADESSYDRAMQRLKSKTYSVDIFPNLDEAAAKRVSKALDKLTGDRTVRILASADTRVAADEIRNLTQRRKVRIGIDVDTRVAADDIANLTRRRTMTVQARADTEGANNSLRFLTRDRTVNVRTNLIGLRSLAGLGNDAGGSAGGIGLLSSSIARLAALAIGALPTIASLGQSLIAMGPAAAVAAPAVLSLASAFAAVKVGTSGIGDAFKAAFSPAVTSGAAAESATRRVETAQRSLAKAQQAVKDAEVAAAEARVKAARDIEDAQQNLKNTVSDVADANRRAAESVAGAERDLADAQRDAWQAQQDLTDARKEAAEELEDLNNRLADAQLDQRQAVLDLQDAQQNLDAVKAKGAAASQEDLDKAQLQYDKAVQALQEQQTETQRLQDDAAAANAAGVEGSDRVTAAKQGIADANQNVQDKTQALTDAEIEAARTQEDGAQRIIKAQRDVADAQAAAAKAARDGARSIADAQASAADAARTLAEAQDSGQVAANKLADAMARLSPQAQAFVGAVIAQAGAWRALKLDVQDALLRGMGQTFTTLSGAILPSLHTGLTGTATILNTTAKNAANAVIQLAKTGTLRSMFDGLNNGMRPLTRIPGQIVTGFAQLSVAASPAFARLTTAAAGAADTISQKLGQAFKSGALEQAINTGIEVAKQFGSLLGDIFGTVGNVMKAAAQGGGDALGALGSVFGELRRITAMPEVQKMLTTIFQAVSQVAKLIAGTLGSVIQAVLPLVAAIAPVIGQLANALGPVLGQLASALGAALMPIIQALLPVVSMVIKGISGVAQAIMPMLAPLGQLIGAIVTALAPVMKVIIDVFVQIVGVLATALTPVIAALIPIVQMIGQFLGQLAPIFGQIILALAPLLGPLAQLSVSLLGLAMSVLQPLLPLIVDLAGMLAGVLADALGILVPVLTTVIGWISKFVDQITQGVQWVVDKFTWLYDVLVGHSIIPDLVNAIVSWFKNLWDKTKQIFTALKDGVVAIWNSLWGTVRGAWNAAWNGLRTAFSTAMTWMRNTVTSLKNAVTSTWTGLWNGVRSAFSSIINTVSDKIGAFSSGTKRVFSALRDALGSIWNGIRSKFSAPIKFVVGTVYNNGIRKMWNTIAGKISSNITLPAIPLGFSEGGVIPGKRSNVDSVPIMAAPGERVLSNQEVDQLGGYRAIDAMLGKDRPARTGGNPTRQQENKRQQAAQHFADGGIVGTLSSIGSTVTGALGSAADWAKGLVLGGLKAAAQKAISSLVRPLINRIPAGGVGSLMKGMSNKALDGILGWLGTQDKKAAGGPAVQRALSWARTQAGKPYQWAGNGNPSWDCSGFMSAIESVIRGQSPHRRWATGAFSGSIAPPGWVRNLNSPFQIGITNAGVGHTAGTIAGVNVESRGGAGVVVGSRARSYKDGLFTDHYGFKPATQFDTGGLLQPGATMSINRTGRPERILSADHTARLDAMLASGGQGGDITIEAINIHGTFDLSNTGGRKAVANALVREMNEALRQFQRERR